MWRKAYERNVMEAKVTNFCLVAIKNVILDKYFAVLKANQQRRRRYKCLAAKTVKSNIRQFFTAFKAVIKRQTLGKKFNTRVQRALKQKAMDEWMRETQEKFFIFDFMRRRSSQRALSVVNAWRSYTQTRVQREQLVQQGQANSNYHLAVKII